MKQKNSLSKIILIMSSIIIFIILIKFHTVNKFDYCKCNDGSISYSHEQGACSSHGGIDEIIYKSQVADLEFGDVIFIFFKTILFTGIVWILFLFFSAFKKK